MALHGALSEAGRVAGVPGGKPTAHFRPHLGVAYNNRDRAAAECIEAVAELRGRPAVEVVVDQVSLVELRREERAYVWDVLHEVPLGR
ncbi:hypothetical protein OTB20_39545 [Streptomyces sp. H27-H1]|uniref:2'-5' RNA ligase family protein n=1 Tax=Streptomyces sp. H27-H1 TaxID=2996461 RepID=UPI00226E3245|nr:2'-5' RNA ligase family protein [Streptomyces sp. H27-H1]MCY0932157.1 hypothetical protein [Streptomyces sp. H27-H1]